MYRNHFAYYAETTNYDTIKKKNWELFANIFKPKLPKQWCKTTSVLSSYYNPTSLKTFLMLFAIFSTNECSREQREGEVKPWYTSAHVGEGIKK